MRNRKSIFRTGAFILGLAIATGTMTATMLEAQSSRGGRPGNRGNGNSAQTNGGSSNSAPSSAGGGGSRKDTLVITAQTSAGGVSPTVPGNAGNQWFYEFTVPGGSSLDETLTLEVQLDDPDGTPDGDTVTVSLRPTGGLARSVAVSDPLSLSDDGVAALLEISLAAETLEAGNHAVNIQLRATQARNVQPSHATIHIRVHAEEEEPGDGDGDDGEPPAGPCTTNATTLELVTVDAPLSDEQPAIQSGSEQGRWQAQTFTVLGSGCFLLNEVTASIRKQGNPGDLLLEIYDVSGDFADTPVIPAGLGGTAAALATATVAAADVSDTYADLTVAFAEPPQIAGGAQYALVVYQDGGSTEDYYQFGLASGEPYDGGRYCKSDDTEDSGWACVSGSPDGLDVRFSICVSDCVNGEGCTLSQGFWKNHAGTDDWPELTGGEMLLGTQAYNPSELLSILQESVGGNGLISLAHQIIAAKLNIANGAPVPEAVQAAIDTADSLIGSIDPLRVPPIGEGFLEPSETGDLTGTLDMYNTGLSDPDDPESGPFPGWPPACEDQEDEPEE